MAELLAIDALAIPAAAASHSPTATLSATGESFEEQYTTRGSAERSSSTVAYFTNLYTELTIDFQQLAHASMET